MFARNGNAISVVDRDSVEEKIATRRLIAWDGFNGQFDAQLLSPSRSGP